MFVCFGLRHRVHFRIFRRRARVSNMRTFRRHTRCRLERTLVNVFNAHTQQYTTTQPTHEHTHTKTSVNTHITITRSRNGPSTRMPRVMLITATVSLFHASAFGCANSGFLAGFCSGLFHDVKVLFPSRRWFACLTANICNW